MPRYAHSLYPVALLRVDEETGEPIRGPDGLCIVCEPGEPGVFVGKINPKKAVNDFGGYVDKQASEKKIVKDVFKKGDRVFNSGENEIHVRFIRSKLGIWSILATFFSNLCDQKKKN